MLAQTLVHLEREEEEKRREEAREDYVRAKEVMQKVFSSSREGGREEEEEEERMLPSVKTVESCRNESELSSGTSALLFNQSCLNINAPEASGVIKELPLTDSTTNEYYFPIAEIYLSLIHI